MWLSLACFFVLTSKALRDSLTIQGTAMFSIFECKTFLPSDVFESKLATSTNRQGLGVSWITRRVNDLPSMKTPSPTSWNRRCWQISPTSTGQNIE